MGLRVIVYDATCPVLSRLWGPGARLYRLLGAADRVLGARDWTGALEWLGRFPAGSLREVQLWSHGKWGRPRIGGESLGEEAFAAGHPHRVRLSGLRAALAGPGAAVWLRCCETFGAAAGRSFAVAAAEFLGCRVAGHTFVIGFFQSGLRVVAPGGRPDWPRDEGLAAGSPDRPVRALGSRPWRPRTVTCLSTRLPRRHFLPRGAPDG